MSHEMEIVAGSEGLASAKAPHPRPLPPYGAREQIALPEPREAITIRPGTVEDIPFLDSLQKLHTKQVGWMPTAQFEGKIRLGHVLVAEQGREIRGEGRGNTNGSPIDA